MTSDARILRVFGWAWPLAVALVLAAPGAAQEPPLDPDVGQPAETAAPPPVSVPAERANARATVMTFLQALNDVADGIEERMEDAVECLDLSQLSAIIRSERGPELAVDLKEVIDRVTYVYPWEIPDDPNAADYVLHRSTSGRIVVGRQPNGEWLFTATTVAAIPTLLDSVSGMERRAGKAIELGFRPDRWLRERVPEPLRAKAFLLEHWQWLGLLALVFLGVLVDKFFTLALALLVRRFFRREQLSFQSETTQVSLRPFGIVAMALIWTAGLRWLGLPDDAYSFLRLAAEFVMAVAAVWGVYRLVDILGEVLSQWSARTESALDDLLVPLAVRSLKIFIVAMGIVFLAHKLEMNIWGLATGLGLGGLAIALAAKDMVGNLFGSIMVIADRTFQVGDWVVIDDIEGTIERVGFRSTRIRTFYNSLVTLPNSTLITASVDNLGRRRYRRWKAMLSLTYDTPPERIEAFCEGIRELVRRHPYTRKDYYEIHLNEFAASSLDVLVYVFFQTPDWSTELRERHRLMLDIMRLARRIGVDFAFPTQTLNVVQTEGDVPEPAEYASERDVNQASMRGRGAARQIISDFGLDESKPPPVRSARESDEETRGEDGE